MVLLKCVLPECVCLSVCAPESACTYVHMDACVCVLSVHLCTVYGHRALSYQVSELSFRLTIKRSFDYYHYAGYPCCCCCSYCYCYCYCDCCCCCYCFLHGIVFATFAIYAFNSILESAQVLIMKLITIIMRRVFT